MQEVYLPSLPKFVVEDVEHNFELNQVTFLLKYGILEVLGCIDAKCVIEKFDVSVSGGNVQNSVERDFKYLVVSETEVSIDQSDIDIKSGQKLILTESQIQKMNDDLKELMVMT